jgi:hypothetical protein
MASYTTEVASIHRQFQAGLKKAKLLDTLPDLKLKDDDKL